jgi:uncharacterized protein
MMDRAKISDELLNAFVDNELESGERSELLDLLVRDEVLKERVCDLRALKEMVHHAYQQPQFNGASDAGIGIKPHARRVALHSLRRYAACVFFLLVGGVSGWFIANYSAGQGDTYAVYISKAINSDSSEAAQRSIVFQVSNSNPIRLKAALDEAENLLEANKQAHGRFNIEIIANADGVDLLRSDTSPFGKRIGLMKAKYPNLDFLACNQTISKLRQSGIAVHLLPNTGIAPSAAAEISRRLYQGWDYARI